MKAILIDPKNCAVTEVEHDGSLGSIYTLTDTDIVETGVCTISHHTLYVDEEGLRKSGTLCFEFGNDLFIGKGLIVGQPDERGDDTAATVSADYVRTMVRFPKIVVR